MMTAESMLSKHPVLRIITVAIIFFLKVFSSLNKDQKALVLTCDTFVPPPKKKTAHKLLPCFIMQHQLIEAL